MWFQGTNIIRNRKSIAANDLYVTEVMGVKADNMQQVDDDYYYFPSFVLWAHHTRITVSNGLYEGKVEVLAPTW